jgi:hypothetical protein
MQITYRPRWEGLVGGLKARKRHADMIVDEIIKATEWTIEETAEIGPRLRKHRTMTATAFSNRTVIAPDENCCAPHTALASAQ